MVKKQEKTARAGKEPVTRDCTVHLHKTHAEDFLQEKSTSSCASGEAICLQGHVDEGRAHRHEVEQVPLEQRCAQCASACARALVPEAQRGWRCKGEDVYIGPTCAGRKLQGSSDWDGQRWLRWLRWGETAVRKAVVRQGSWVGNSGNLRKASGCPASGSCHAYKILTSLRAEGALYRHWLMSSHHTPDLISWLMAWGYAKTIQAPKWRRDCGCFFPC